ncbi:sarcosine oxidase subunit delta [Shimia ponticola]|uniref:sarcosine oxidase subunit delta n=1 Tax=Shimia ponticola TaxID=2582893 RepID=UPI0011BF7567|nr:sarcosine oxidase subunit delta [Shimia ponticola]
MKISCPICGDRDIREFTCMGHASMLNRPDPHAGAKVWNEYLHNRENPAGVIDELWWHGQGCGAWLVVTRNTVTHEILGARLARDVKKEMRDAG